MAVSFLEQRIAPLVEVVPYWHPFGPLGIAPWQELVEDGTLPLTPLLASESKLGRSHSWAGFAPHRLSGRELEKPTQVPTLARGQMLNNKTQDTDQMLNYNTQEWDGTPEPASMTCTTQEALEHMQASYHRPSARFSKSTTADDTEDALGFLPTAPHAPMTSSEADDNEAFIADYLANFYGPASAKSGSRTSPTYRVLQGGSCPGSFLCSSETSDHGGEEEEGAMCHRAHVGGSFDWSVAQRAGQATEEMAPGMPRMHRQAVVRGTTTVMVQNVARKLSRAGFMDVLDSCGFQGLYDFVHLPGVFGTGKNKGFAFVNFVTEEAAAAFSNLFTQNQNLRGVEAAPKAPQDPSGWRVAPAAVQGLEANTAMAGSRKMRRVRSNAHRPLFLPERNMHGGRRS